MTVEEVSTLPAGPELDTLVAVHCLGWRWWVDPRDQLAGLWPPHEEDRRNWAPSFVLAGGDGLTDGGVQCYCDYDSFLPRSSTSWKDAGALVDHFGAGRKDDWFALELQTRGQCLVWRCCWCSEEATGTTAQEAVCRAAVLYALNQQEVPS
jgi:hypothetical protein